MGEQRRAVGEDGTLGGVMGEQIEEGRWSALGEGGVLGEVKGEQTQEGGWSVGRGHGGTDGGGWVK